MPVVLLVHEQFEIEDQKQRVSIGEFKKWFDSHPIKSRVKKVCMYQQRLRCCYCMGYTNSTNNNEWDLEHVLSEKDYPQFFAEPLNLAVACKRCNGKKKDKNVLIENYAKDLTSVPSSADDYTIPHPHLTVWGDHLSHTAFLIYEGKTAQGKNLIEVCELRSEVEEAIGGPIGSIKTAIATSFFARVGPLVPDTNEEEAVRIAAGAGEALEEVRFAKLEGKLKMDIARAEQQVKKRQKLHIEALNAV